MWRSGLPGWALLVNNIRDAGSVPGLGRSPGGKHGKPLRYPCLETRTDREDWRAAVHELAQSRTQHATGSLGMVMHAVSSPSSFPQGQLDFCHLVICPALDRAPVVGSLVKKESMPAGAGVQSPSQEDGDPLQCSCLENRMDGGAWWAAVRGVTKGSGTTETQ